MHETLTNSAGDLITAILAPTGGRPLAWTVRDADHQPGDSTTVSYAVRVEWTGGTVTEETLGAIIGRLPDGVARLSQGDTEVGMWRFPVDPELPGLPAACDPVRLGQLLDLPAKAIRPRVRAYRPRRRAVVEVSTPDGVMYVKVLRPNRVTHLHEIYRSAAAAGCATPEPLRATSDGLLVLTGLTGETLRSRLLSGVSTVAGVVEVLNTLPATLAGGPVRKTWGQQAPHYAEVIAATVPSLARRARTLAAEVDHKTPEGPPVAVHGDFYEAQLLVRDGLVSGLLDLDTAGRGERLDDAACLLAHLSVLAQIHPEAARAIDELQRTLCHEFARDLDPAALARRTAAVVLSLATGPHRVHKRGWRTATAHRLDLAERWLVHGRQ